MCDLHLGKSDQAGGGRMTPIFSLSCDDCLNFCQHHHPYHRTRNCKIEANRETLLEGESNPPLLLAETGLALVLGHYAGSTNIQ